MEEIITKRLHVSGLTPAITSADLSQRLGNFGTIKALDGFGLLDGVGQPRKFGYVTLETTKKKLGQCMNILSGATWKGTKLRIGEAKPDFSERIAKEQAIDADPEPPKKRRRLPRGVHGVHAADMSLVTPENASGRSGWRVSATGRLIRRVRMRPDHPLPEPLHSAAVAKKVKGEKASGRKRKRVRDPPTRARRKTIDPTMWGSEHLKGIFLDSVVAIGEESIALQKKTEVPEDSEDGQSESDEEVVAKDDDEQNNIAQNFADHAAPALPSPPSHPPVARPLVHEKTIQDSTHKDLVEEKQKSLGLLQSLFGGNEDEEWGGEESVGSDAEQNSDTRRNEGPIAEDTEELAQEVIMDIDRPDDSAERLRPIVQSTKLKDLFAPREEDAGFSLLGHLDLDLELDDEVDHQFAPQPLTLPEAQPVTAAPTVSFSTTLDARRPLFFPLPSDERRQGRVRDALDPTDWRTWFFRTDSAEDIQKRWEETRGELTSGWKRRHREAVKSRRRRGGGPGEEL